MAKILPNKSFGGGGGGGGGGSPSQKLSGPTILLEITLRKYRIDLQNI